MLDMDKKNTIFIAITCILVFVSSLGGYFAGYEISEKSIQKNIYSKPLSNGIATEMTPAPIGTNIIANVAANAMPWVVNIRMQYNNNINQNVPELLFPFSPFPGFEQNFPQKIKIAGGSGIIIKKDGYILTNNHVTENADDIEVNLNNGKSYKAEIVGRDNITDLAVLKINPDKPDLPEAKLGNSSKLRIGDWVIAVGSPLGYEETVTHGIISAINRRVRDIPASVDFIQTDAAINPGNSGGPLISLNGEVIGVNTAIRADAQNIGFAIPVNTAKNIADQLIKHKTITRPWVGIEMKELQLGAMGIGNAYGQNKIQINKIWPGSPAEKGGLKKGDLILKVDGKKIEDARDIQEQVRTHKVGDSIKFEVLRNKQKITVNLITEKLPEFSQKNIKISR